MNFESCRYYAKYVGRHTSRLYGISWEIQGGEEHLARKGGAVAAANHQQEFVGIVGTVPLWPIMTDGCAAVAKREHLRNPFRAGFLARRTRFHRP